MCPGYTGLCHCHSFSASSSSPLGSRPSSRTRPLYRAPAAGLVPLLLNTPPCDVLSPVRRSVRCAEGLEATPCVCCFPGPVTMGRITVSVACPDSGGWLGGRAADQGWVSWPPGLLDGVVLWLRGGDRLSVTAVCGYLPAWLRPLPCNSQRCCASGRLSPCLCIGPSVSPQPRHRMGHRGLEPCTGPIVIEFYSLYLYG